MSNERDYPRLLTPPLQTAVREHDLAEAVRLFLELCERHDDALELWAELMDDLSHAGYAWRDWAEVWPGGEEGLERGTYFLVVGIQALQEEAFERAGYYLQRAAEVRPDSPIPLAYLGIMFESQGCPADALVYYKHALEVEPELFSVLNAVGNLYHELGFFEEAVEYYRRAFPLLHEACNQALLLGNLGNSLRALGQLDEAVAIYTEAVATDPSQPSNPLFLAETLLEAKRMDSAVGCLTDLMQMPDFDEWPADVRQRCYGLLAAAYWEERKFPASLLFMWLRNAQRLDEEDREGVSSLLKTLYGWAIAEPGNAVHEYLLAKLNRHLGYMDAALHHAKRAAKAQPDRPEHFVELGAALLLHGKTPVALEALEEAAILAPERAEVHALQAQALFELDRDRAEAALHEAVRLEPNQAMHHVDLAFLYQADGNDFLIQDAFQRAVLLWDRAPVLYGPHGPAAQRGGYSDVIEAYLPENANSPEAATRLLTAANFLVLSGRREPARKALHRLLAEQPNHLDALRNYAWLLTRGGWLQEALSIWRKVLAIAPDDMVSRYFALSCLASEGTQGKEKAIPELEAALAGRVDYFLGRQLLAKLLEPGPEALEHLEVLCFQLPNVYSPWYWRGSSCYHRRQFDAARTFLERSVGLNGHYAPARKLLSQTHQQLGDTVEAQVQLGFYYMLSGKHHQARMQFEDALMRNPSHAEALQALARVDRWLGRLERPRPGDLYHMIAPRFRVN